ncbi:MAG: hypothetical protein HZA53_00400 [Planctomycetes bacterium]|nr:hypothetical protein [Planctomycetota bacterium]
MNRRATWVLIALLVLTRAWLVLCAADVNGYGEEFGKGAAAKAMLDGLGVEHWRLAYVYHEGGGFLITHLKALAFLLVGPTVLANKLVALFTTTLLLLVGLRLCRAHFGERAAACFGLAFVFAPDAFLRFSLLSLGTHFEASILLALIAHFTLRIVGGSSSTARDWLGLGLVAGLGLYFSLLTLAVLAWAGFALVLFARGELLSRKFFVACAGAVFGALPLCWMMSHVGLDALFVRGKEGGATAKVERLTALGDVFTALGRGAIGPWVLATAYALLAALGLALVRGNPDAMRRRKLLLVGTFVPVFLALYVASGMAIRPESGWFFFLRLSPVWFFGTVFVAACTGELLEHARGTTRFLAIGSFACIVGVGTFDFAALSRAGWLGAPRFVATAMNRAKGYDYAEYFDKFQYHLDGSLEDKIAVLRRYDDDPELLLPAISLSLFEHAGVSLDEAVAISKRAHGEQWTTAIKGLRFFVHPSFGHDLAAGFAAIESVEPAARAPLAEAVGRAGLGPRFVPEKIAKELEFVPPDDLRTAFLRGAGWRVHRAFGLRRDRANEFILALPIQVQAGVRDGFERARAADGFPPIR